MKKLALAFVASGILLTGCEKDNDISLEGTYSGTFIYSYPASSVAPPPSGPASVTFNEDNTYTSTGNSSYVPAGGSGTFKITGTETVQFNDVNFWTANFDSNLILNGTYTFYTKGDSLFMAKYISEFKVYEYRLKRAGNSN